MVPWVIWYILYQLISTWSLFTEFGLETEQQLKEKVQIETGLFVNRTIGNLTRVQRKLRRVESNRRLRSRGSKIRPTFGRLPLTGSGYMRRRFSTVCLDMLNWIPVLVAVLNMLCKELTLCNGLYMGRFGLPERTASLTLPVW